MKEKIKIRIVVSKRFLIGFIGIFFLFNSLFALTYLEEKRKEFEKHKPKYVPTTSTPKLDRELAESKTDTQRNYKIKEQGPYEYLMSPDEKETYITINLEGTGEILGDLGKDRVIYLYLKSPIVWNYEKKNVKDVGYVMGVKILDEKGHTIKDLNVGGYFYDFQASEDGSFFIIKEEAYSCLDNHELEAMPGSIANPAHFSTKKGILAFDGNGNELWEEELDNNCSIYDRVTKFSRTGKYLFIRIEGGKGDKRYIYSRNGEKEKTPVDMYEGYFSRNEQYFIRYSHGSHIYIYDLKTKDKIYVGAGIVGGAECVDVSDREAGVAVATSDEGYLYIKDVKEHMLIAKIDVNHEYYRKWNEASKLQKKPPKPDMIKELYISSDGTEILIKTPTHEYRYKRVEK